MQSKIKKILFHTFLNILLLIPFCFIGILAFVLFPILYIFLPIFLYIIYFIIKNKIPIIYLIYYINFLLTTSLSIYIFYRIASAQ